MKAWNIFSSVLSILLLFIVVVLWQKVSLLEKQRGASSFSSIMIHSDKYPNSMVEIRGDGIRISNPSSSNINMLDAGGMMVTHAAGSHEDPQAVMAGLFGQDNKPFIGLLDGININQGGKESCENKNCNEIDIPLATPGFYLNHNLNPRVAIGVTDLTSPTMGGSETTSPSSIVLFDKKGTVVARLPYGN